MEDTKEGESVPNKKKEGRYRYCLEGHKAGHCDAMQLPIIAEKACQGTGTNEDRRSPPLYRI